MNQMNDKMDENDKVVSLIEQLKKSLEERSISEEQYSELCPYEGKLMKMGIDLCDVKELLDLKAKLAFCPAPRSYSIMEQERVDYIYENIDNPNIGLSGEYERNFRKAVRSYYQVEEEYRKQLQEMSKLAKVTFEKYAYGSYKVLEKSRETEELINLFLCEQIPPETIKSLLSDIFFHRSGLTDAYCMNDGGISLQWKVGTLLESRGLISPGTAKQVFTNTGLSVDKQENGLRQFRVDKLRVSDIEILNSNQGIGTYIHCKVDGVEHIGRKLCDEDIPYPSFGADISPIAVKYYKDVLDENREKGLEIANERTLVRRDMDYVDRVVDIYRNGTNEQDLRLIEASKHNKDADWFWWGYQDSGMAAPKVEDQKAAVFDILLNYIDRLRPGTLTDDELVELCATESLISLTGRDKEMHLMDLPVSFFPIIEQSEAFDKNMLAYVKVVRGIGMVTPQMALGSMEYYLSMRARPEWDPERDVNEYGEFAGASFYPYINMENPAGRFAPNLISEKEWERLKTLNPLKESPFIPFGAFQKDRIAEVQVYPARDGSMMMRCMIDGVQQGARTLSDEMGEALEKNVDKDTLAAFCFADVFDEGIEREYMLRR